MLGLELGQVRCNTGIVAAMVDLDKPVVPAHDACTVLQAQVLAVDAQWGLAKIALGAGGASGLWVPKAGVAAGDTLRARIAAQDVSLSLGAALPDSSVQNHVQGSVVQIQSDPREPLAMVAVRCGDATVLARTTRRALSELDLRVGNAVWLHIKAAAIRT